MANTLKGKKIVLGITGSIAAYKACYIIRGLIKQGAEVQVVITPAGKEFITPITLSALTSKMCIRDRSKKEHYTLDYGTIRQELEKLSLIHICGRFHELKRIQFQGMEGVCKRQELYVFCRAYCPASEGSFGCRTTLEFEPIHKR